MDLNTIWFILIAVLFTGYFFLEGFDYGVGILLPFLGKDEEERGRIIATIGPHWDANEVWLITAGGAMFALSAGAAQAGEIPENHWTLIAKNHLGMHRGNRGGYRESILFFSANSFRSSWRC